MRRDMATSTTSRWLDRPEGKVHVFDEEAHPPAQNPVIRGRLLSVLAEM